MADFYNTVDTTRIPYDNSPDIAVEVNRMVWPAAQSPKSPRVVILVPDNVYHYSFMAASLIHDPIMGTLLPTSPDRLYPIIKEEIVRLSPRGTTDIQPVIMVGPFRPKVVREVEKMGYEVLLIRGKNIFDTAASIASVREAITPVSPDGPTCLFVISSDDPYEGMPVPYYSAHSGVPILLTQPKKLPPVIARLLKEMSSKTVYIIGGQRSVSDKVLGEISGLVEAPVRRISGRDPFETAVEFAMYYDADTGLGWNRDKKGRGDAFTFCNVERWDLAIACTPLAHQGKHTPLLAVGREEVPPVVIGYLEALKPPLKMPPMPPFMHGFILGTEEVVRRDAQVRLEQAMKIDISKNHREE